jgi:hypothetical protein
MEAAYHAFGREYSVQQEDWFLKTPMVLLLKKTTACPLWQNPVIGKKYFPSLKIRGFYHGRSANKIIVSKSQR